MDGQTIDSAALGEAIAKTLAPALREIVSAGRPQETPKDHFQSALDEVIASSADGTVSVDSVLKLLEAHGQRITQAQTKEVQNLIMSERRGRIIAQIDREIAKYAENDELIAENAELIRDRFIKDFDNTDLTEYARDRQSFNKDGSVAPQTVKALVKKHVDRIDKAAERRGTNKETGAKGVTTTDKNSTGAKQAADPNDLDSLSPVQKELFQSHYGLLLRSGKTAEVARAESMKAAQRRKA